MTALPGVFNSDNHEDVAPFEPVPAGEYVAQIAESEISDNKAKTGKYIKFTFVLMDEKYRNRKLWAYLNIIHPNDDAVKMAQRELATICRAVGKRSIADTAELHNIPMKLQVKIRKASGDYPASNEIVGYSQYGGASVAPGFAAAPAQTQPAAAAAAPASAPEGAAQTPPATVPWA